MPGSAPVGNAGDHSNRAPAPVAPFKSSAASPVASASTRNACVRSVGARTLAQLLPPVLDSLPKTKRPQASQPHRTAPVRNRAARSYKLRAHGVRRRLEPCGETAGTRIETWPPEVLAFMDQHVVGWIEDDKGLRGVVRGHPIVCRDPASQSKKDDAVHAHLTDGRSPAGGEDPLVSAPGRQATNLIAAFEFAEAMGLPLNVSVDIAELPGTPKQYTGSTREEDDERSAATRTSKNRLSLTEPRGGLIFSYCLRLQPS